MTTLRQKDQKEAPELDKGTLHETFQISDQKALIEKSYHRIDVVEKFLSTKAIDEEQRSKLESELSDLKEILKRSEKELQELNMSNRETTKIAFIVIFIIFFIYCIYAIFSNTN